MESKEILTNKNERVSVVNSQINQQPNNKERVIITGLLTSRIEVKPSSDIPAYGFFKIEDQEVDTPVIFRIKDQQDQWLKPTIPKGSTCKLFGYWKTSKTSERPSFTAWTFDIVEEPKSLTTIVSHE